jgi:hypothetical protein
MVFRDEKRAVATLSELIFEAGESLFSATKYLYALSGESYYSCDVKDVFKVILNNVRSADSLSAFPIHVDDSSCTVLNTAEYKLAFRLMVFSFAVRLPAFCNVKVEGERMSDAQISAVYNSILKQGISDPSHIITEKFQDIRTAVRKGSAIPPYNAEWFRAYLYGAIPEFAQISNRNFFFFGAVDVLFYLFSLCLEKEVEGCLHSLCSPESD